MTDGNGESNGAVDAGDEPVTDAADSAQAPESSTPKSSEGAAEGSSEESASPDAAESSQAAEPPVEAAPRAPSRPVGIVSDLHANAAALLAVQRDMRKRKIREVWCLGDLVGYGPHVSAVMSVILRNRSRWTHVAGNHDDYIVRVHRGETTIDEIKASRNARAAIRRQIEQLDDDELERIVGFLEALPKTAMPRDDVLLVHPKDASLPIYPGSDLVENHILGRQEHQAMRQYAELGEGRLIVLRGHTHRPVCFLKGEDGWYDAGAEEGVIELKGRDAWINPGSVGESRVKGDPRAFYAVYDPDADTVEFIRLKYAAEAVGRECERVDIPVRPAWRTPKPATVDA